MSCKFKYFPTLASLLSVVILTLVSLSMAQNIVTGGISGTVTDPSGAVIPSTTVNLKSNSTGETQTTNHRYHRFVQLPAVEARILHREHQPDRIPSASMKP
jgi:hypothetical protein